MGVGEVENTERAIWAEVEGVVVSTTATVPRAHFRDLDATVRLSGDVEALEMGDRVTIKLPVGRSDA